IQQSREHYLEAKDDYLQAEALLQDGRALAWLANFEIEKRAWPTAADSYKKAIAAGFSTAEVFNNLGYCLEVAPGERSKYTTARIYLDCALELNPNLGIAYYNRARVSYVWALGAPNKERNWELQQAINDIEEAMR